MNALLKSAYVACLVLWIGGLAFLSFAVLPTLFAHLPVHDAGRIAGMLFPIYDRLGLACAIVLVLVTVILALRLRGAWKGVVAAAVLMALLQGYSTLVLHPEVAALRGKPEMQARFDQLHRRSVEVLGCVLLTGLVLTLSSGALLGNERS